MLIKDTVLCGLPLPMRPRAALRLLAALHGVGLAVSPLYELLSLQECEQLQKMYGGQIDERTLEKTQQQHKGIFPSFFFLPKKLDVCVPD